jgi:hypothetical protein
VNKASTVGAKPRAVVGGGGGPPQKENFEKLDVFPPSQKLKMHFVEKTLRSDKKAI